jgi:hypothetical protein
VNKSLQFWFLSNSALIDEIGWVKKVLGLDTNIMGMWAKQPTIRAFVALIFLWLISYKNKFIHPYLNLIQDHKHNKAKN